MQNFDWNLVRSFLSALEAGSLAEASRRTGVSQSTLGRHLDELERTLGVTLFERGRMGLLPTSAALEVAEAAREMQAASAALTMAATGSAERVSGTVRITASQIVATYILPAVLSDLLQELPDIEVELVASNTVENLLQRDADIAIRMARPTMNDLITRHINAMAMGIYAHRTYLEGRAIPEDIDSLRQHVLIGYDRNDLILRGFEAMGYKVDRSLFRYRCDDQVAAFEALASGVGIGFAPRPIARRHPDLVEIMKEISIDPLPMWLTAHRELRTSRKIRTVNDFLADRLSSLDLT